MILAILTLLAIFTLLNLKPPEKVDRVNKVGSMNIEKQTITSETLEKKMSRLKTSKNYEQKMESGTTIEKNMESGRAIEQMTLVAIKEELAIHEDDVKRDQIIERLNTDGEIDDLERKMLAEKFKRMSSLRIAMTKRELASIEEELEELKSKTKI